MVLSHERGQPPPKATKTRCEGSWLGNCHRSKASEGAGLESKYGYDRRWVWSVFSAENFISVVQVRPWLKALSADLRFLEWSWQPQSILHHLSAYKFHYPSGLYLQSFNLTRLPGMHLFTRGGKERCPVTVWPHAGPVSHGNVWKSPKTQKLDAENHTNLRSLISQWQRVVEGRTCKPCAPHPWWWDLLQNIGAEGIEPRGVDLKNSLEDFFVGQLHSSSVSSHWGVLTVGIKGRG